MFVKHLNTWETNEWCQDHSYYRAAWWDGQRMQMDARSGQTKLNSMMTYHELINTIKCSKETIIYLLLQRILFWQCNRESMQQCQRSKRDSESSRNGAARLVSPTNTLRQVWCIKAILAMPQCPSDPALCLFGGTFPSSQRFWWMVRKAHWSSTSCQNRGNTIAK